MYNAGDLVETAATALRAANNTDSSLSAFDIINESMSEVRKIKSTLPAVAQDVDTAEDILSKIRNGQLDAYDVDRNLGYRICFVA